MAGEMNATLNETEIVSSLVASAEVKNIESEESIMKIMSFDGYPLECKLTIPQGDSEITKLVIFVQGSGPATYENREVINGMDLNMFAPFGDEFAKSGAAFLMYSQRGIHANDTPPLFYDINAGEYQTYLPLNTVEDIAYMIDAAKQDERLKNCKVYLWGMSEGTLVASLFAEKYPDKVDALFLMGYMNENMGDVLAWQLSGKSFVYLFKEYFETDDAGRISKEAFESGQKEAIVTGFGLGEDAFQVIDTDQDGYIEEDEMIALGKSLIGFNVEDFFAAAERKDDDWLLNGEHGQKMTSGFLSQHLGLRPNKEILPELDLPIFIFQGTLDMNTDVQGVYDIEQRFRELGKTNLETHVYKGLGHGLDMVEYLLTGVTPECMGTFFNAVSKIQ
jgi:pimeloyl-ACP methyl ester carboxylesterase